MKLKRRENPSRRNPWEDQEEIQSEKRSNLLMFIKIVLKTISAFCILTLILVIYIPDYIFEWIYWVRLSMIPGWIILQRIQSLISARIYELRGPHIYRKHDSYEGCVLEKNMNESCDKISQCARDIFSNPDLNRETIDSLAKNIEVQVNELRKSMQDYIGGKFIIQPPPAELKY